MQLLQAAGTTDRLEHYQTTDRAPLASNPARDVGRIAAIRRFFSNGVANLLPARESSMKKTMIVPVVAASALALAACAETSSVDTASNASPITAAEVEAAQTAWGEGIITIGEAFTNEGDYRQAATDHIDDFYAYEESETVLFKPTLAAENQFRGTSEGALSYFVGTEGTEDDGFALAPYTAVRWENEGTVIDEDGDKAVAMGNYYFTGTDGAETKVEYTFGYIKDEDGDLKITVHHSSLPFSDN